MARITKSQYYLNIAKDVAQRATCLRRIYGAVIVVNDQIVSTGYCGAPRRIKDCHDRKECLRRIKNVPSGQRYELCRSVHAEQNAIINAARAGVSIFGGSIYIYGYDLEKEEICKGYPCIMCLKMVMNAGLTYIFYTEDSENKEGYGATTVENVRIVWNARDIID